jgi:hypothetical protein
VDLKKNKNTKNGATVVWKTEQFKSKNATDFKEISFIHCLSMDSNYQMHAINF